LISITSSGIIGLRKRRRNSVLGITFKHDDVLLIFHVYFSKFTKMFPLYSGKSKKETVTLEDGRIGERPEIIYHVIHTLLLGSLAMLMEG
jgi:hypothetical protein